MENFDSFIGQSFGNRYNVINVIGTGEYSVVFGAYDTVDDKTVALKILRPEYNNNPEVSERFATEVNILSLLSHPNIVKLYEKDLNAPVRFFAMEYIEGINLKKHILSRGSLDSDEILFFSEQILAALAEVHAKGVVHCDIKPQNIVVLGNGSIRLMDFGIAAFASAKEDAMNTEKDPDLISVFGDVSADSERSEIAVGTVHYVSPEQAEGKPLDHLSDIYSFGVMLYEMATGVLPFFDESAQRIATMHVRLQPIPPSRLDPDIPEGLEAIILRAMEKLPFARFPSAESMWAELARFGETLRAPSPVENGVEEKPKPFFERIKEGAKDYIKNFSLPAFVVGSLCALLVTVVIGLGILSDALLTERREKDHLRVPDLVGQKLSDAAGSLDPDLYHITVTYVDKSEEPGRIVSQNPSGGSIEDISEGNVTEIHLEVGRNPLPHTMPDLRFLPYEKTAELLSAYDCEITVIECPHAYIPRGEIISTAPAAGEATTHKITLYVSQGWTEQE